MGFSEIIGNRKIIDLIARGVRDGTLYPSLIFYGKEGIGKRRTALIAARSLNCLSEGERPCDLCASCKGIESNNHPDVRYILPEFYDERLKPEERKSFSLKIEQIREVAENIGFKPFTGRKKVYIIDYAETLTDEAANALLKTLEEPPLYALLILITSAYHSLLPTVRSRCWALPFHPVPPHEIEELLVKERGIDRAEARLLALLCEGSVGKAMHEDVHSLISRSENIMDFIEDSIAGKIPDMMRDAENMSGKNRGERSKKLEEFRRNLGTLVSLLRDSMVLELVKDDSLLINSNLTDRLRSVQARLSTDSLDLFEKALETQEILDLNINPKVAAEALLLRIAGVHPPRQD